jgi:uncharacterized protein (TIGR02001 family)
MSTKRIEITCAAGALMAASLGTMSLALADSPHSFSANIGVASNYVWRGVTQTDDKPSVSGGLDYAHSSGFSAGTWVSNVDFGTDANYELDLYAGYDFDLGNEDVSLGLNTIFYAYPDEDGNTNFWEIGISGGYKWFSAGIQYTVWNGSGNDGGYFTDGDIYYFGAFDYTLPYDFGLNLHGGYYDFSNDTAPGVEVADPMVGVDGDNNIVVLPGEVLAVGGVGNYSNWGVSISKEAGDFGTFSLNYDQNNGNEKDGYDNDPLFWVSWNKEF